MIKVTFKHPTNKRVEITIENIEILRKRFNYLCKKCNLSKEEIAKTVAYIKEHNGVDLT